MNRIRATLAALFALAFVLSPAILFADDDLFADAPEAARAAIASGQGLGAEGKWLTAWNTLSAADPDKKDGFILAEKIRVAMEGNVQNAMYLVFAFTDLPAGMDLQSVRNAGVEGLEPVEFDPWAEAQALEKEGLAFPPVLALRLGDYFSAVLAEYAGQWLQDDQTVSRLAIEQYDRAHAYDVFTVTSLVRHASLLNSTGNSAAAEPVLRKALEADPDNAEIPLLLVDSQAAQGRLTEALEGLDALIAKAADPASLYELLTKGVQISLQSDQPGKSERYLSEMETVDPANSLPGLVRHLLAVRAQDKALAAEVSDKVLQQFPNDSEVISSMLGTWLSSGDPEGGFAFLDRNIAVFEGKPETQAVLYFYRALMDAETAQGQEGRQGLDQAIADIEKAEALFKQFVPEDNPLYQTIADLKGQWVEQPASGVAAEQSGSGAPTPAEPQTAPADADADANSAATEWE